MRLGMSDSFPPALRMSAVVSLNALSASRSSRNSAPQPVARTWAAFLHGTRVTPPMVERVPAFPARLKESAPRKGFIGDAEYAVHAKNAKDLWLRALIAVAFRFGFRKRELLHLRVEQVDLLDRWITLREGETKNNEGRKVKMTSEVYELLRECVRGKKYADYVFTRASGERVGDPRQEWYDLCVASKLGSYVSARRKNGEEFKSYHGLNLHDFRRSAVREMVRRGVSQTVAMKISGHKTASVFRRYDITDESDLEHASALIEAGRKETPKFASTKVTRTALAQTAKPS